MGEFTADESHPRYNSLLSRHKLEIAASKGMLADSAMIAHGRGEAFDYLLGEKSSSNAIMATKNALAHLNAAKRPIITINGNTAALAGKELMQIAEALNCPVEINIFYRTEKRIMAIIKGKQLTDSLSVTNVTGSNVSASGLIIGSSGSFGNV